MFGACVCATYSSYTVTGCGFTSITDTSGGGGAAGAAFDLPSQAESSAHAANAAIGTADLTNAEWQSKIKRDLLIAFSAARFATPNILDPTRLRKQHLADDHAFHPCTRESLYGQGSPIAVAVHER